MLTKINKKLSQILKSRFFKKIRFLFLGLIVSLFLFLVILLVALFYQDKFYPHISVLGMNIGSLQTSSIRNPLDKKINGIEEQSLLILNKESGQEITTNLKEMGVIIDREKILETAFRTGRDENIFRNSLTILENVFWGYQTPVYFKINKDQLIYFIENKLESPGELPQTANIIYENGVFATTPARKGKGIDRFLFISQIIDYINNPSPETIILTEKIALEPAIKEHQTEEARDFANWLINNKFSFVAGNKSWTIAEERLVEFIKFRTVTDNSLEKNDLSQFSPDVYTAFTGIIPPSSIGNYKMELELNEENIRSYLREIAPGIEQPAVNVVLEFKDNALQIKSGSQDKIIIDPEKNVASLIEGILKKKEEIQLQISYEKAPVWEGNLEELGIQTLVGEGQSNFVGSPKNRRHNITVGASKFNGILIPPGEVFSFLDNLGPVDASTGYLPELVIKHDKTIPEYGGGMCQVSTTAFRGAVNSGFEIIERKNHAYPVQYYSPQGTDATVYIPSPDLKFLNNTPGWIFIQTRIEGNLLFFEYYGSSDGRRVETIGPVIYDRRSDGSLKSKWTQKVYDKNNNLIIEKEFLSKYDSPNKYPHPGEEPKEDDTKKKKKKKD